MTPFHYPGARSESRLGKWELILTAPHRTLALVVLVVPCTAHYLVVLAVGAAIVHFVYGC
jgi:hypothetical protein